MKRFIFIMTAVFLIFWTGWYLFPKQFYLFGTAVSTFAPWDIITPDPAIDTIAELDAFYRTSHQYSLSSEIRPL